MKRLISLFILLQVGSQTWVNPQYVVGVVAGTSTQVCKDSGSEVILATGSDSTRPFVCSDWNLETVLKQLHYMYDRQG